MKTTRGGKCIFCDRGAKLTKEHLFSEWLVEFFPRTDADTHTIGEIEFPPSGPVIKERARQGHSGSKKIRKVCQLCNNEWMSGIDAAAKTALTPILNGGATLLTPAMQADIATWVSKIAIVGDSNRTNQSKVAQAERDWMRANKAPPSNWQVWIGSYSGTAYRDLFIYQYGGHLSAPPVPSATPFSGYVKTTVMGIGPLFVLVIATDISVLGFEIGVNKLLMRQIWLIANDIAWPLPVAMSDNDATHVANILQTMIARPLQGDPNIV